MKGIVTYNLRGFRHSMTTDLVMGEDGAWKAPALPTGATLETVTLTALPTNRPWTAWLEQCAEGLDGIEPLLTGDTR